MWWSQIDDQLLFMWASFFYEWVFLTPSVYYNKKYQDRQNWSTLMKMCQLPAMNSIYILFCQKTEQVNVCGLGDLNQGLVRHRFWLPPTLQSSTLL